MLEDNGTDIATPLAVNGLLPFNYDAMMDTLDFGLQMDVLEMCTDDTGRAVIVVQVRFDLIPRNCDLPHSGLPQIIPRLVVRYQQRWQDLVAVSTRLPRGAHTPLVLRIAR